MKKNFTTLLLLLVSICFAQIPNGYYNSATGTGYILKTQLHNIIKNHNDRGYSGLYVTYTTSDKDFYYENDGTMLDMYTENPTGAECEFTYGINQDDGTLGNAECERYNREHLIPQSVFGSGVTPMYSDAHFVVPSDKYVNAQRGDLPFSRVNAVTNTYSNGSKKGNNLNSGYSNGYNGTVFEPINEFKGDIARMLLYFATRYEDQVANWNFAMFNNTSNQVFTNQAINVLLTWSNDDPVSQREIDRNNAIYARQNNRNPYIDHPEYAMQIWGSLLNTDQYLLDPTVTISPNPSNDGRFTITTSSFAIDAISVLNVNGQVIQYFKNPAVFDNQYEVSNLSKGFYFITIDSNNQRITKKVIVN
ncbi:MAG: endonuclease [Flavobacterium sp.]|uniref:endonuclease n=1 Tax=Flavobacterium sp. TaxID=239 RepID=UPI003526FBE0